MRKSLSLLVSAVLILSLFPAARGAEGTAPTSPEWVAAEDYLTFPGDPVYEPENWERVEQLRQAAAAGALLPEEGRDWAEGSVGQCYETALLRLKYAENAGEDALAAGEAFRSAGRAFEAAESARYDLNRGKDAVGYRLALEKYRAYLLYHPAYISDWGRGIVPALDALGMELEELYDAPYMDRVSQETRAVVEESVMAYRGSYIPEKDRICVYLDGEMLAMDTLPQVREERTMVPVRAVAEALGADVEWWPETEQIVMKRAGSTVVMTLGQTTARVDGRAVDMDVAPYAAGERTYIPVRYVAEFFGQKVSWVQESRRVDITEDKSKAEQSNLEDWALAMGALMSLWDGGDPARFGLCVRAPYTVSAYGEQGVDENTTVFPRELCRTQLEEKWGITDREGLLSAIGECINHSYDKDFQTAADLVAGMSDGEIKRITAKLSPVDQYMWPRTKEMAKRWGDKGILAWDLLGASALVQRGYTAGYLTYDEALEQLEPAARELAETFDSWDEVYENYLEGYFWCVREDLGKGTVWDTDLGKMYLYVRNAPDTVTLFDSTLFETGVIGLLNDNKK